MSAVRLSITYQQMKNDEGTGLTLPRPTDIVSMCLDCVLSVLCGPFACGQSQTVKFLMPLNGLIPLLLRLTPLVLPLPSLLKLHAQQDSRDNQAAPDDGGLAQGLP